MRVTVDNRVAVWTGGYPLYQAATGVKMIYERGTPAETIRTFSRSDVTKVTQVDGWRKPTAYKSDEVSALHPKLSHLTLYAAGSGLFGGYSNTYEGSCYSDTNLYPAAGAPDTATWNSLYYAAVATAKDQAINIAVTLAELGETISLISGRGKLFGELFDLARAKRWAELLRHLNLNDYSFRKGKNDVAGRWMELWFGWNPILQDIYAAVDTLGRKARAGGLTVVARATRPETSVVEQFNLPVTWRRSYGKYAAGLVTNFDGSRERDTECVSSRSGGHKVQLWFTVDNPRLQLASALGLTNPLSVIWELTPLSWFADFFVDIGNWLESLDTLGLTFKGGTASWWYSRSLEIKSVSAMYSDGTVNMVTSGGGGLYARKQSERKVITDTPLPFHLKNPFSIWKAVTTSALVAQKFR